MPKLNVTKCNKIWISQNHENFNEMEKVMLWNWKIKEMQKIALELW